MLANGLSMLLILSKNQLLVLLICSTVLLVSISLSSAQIFTLSVLLGVGFIYCSFSNSFRCKVSLCLRFFSNLLRDACIAMHFPLRIALAVSQGFWMVVSSFSLVSMNLLISSLIFWLTHSSFSRMVFLLPVFAFLPDFFLWLSSSFKALWSENMQGTVPMFWYRVAYSEKVPWEDCVFSCFWM